MILPGWGGLESENPRSGVLAGEFSESRGRAVRRSGKDSRVLDSQERWVQRLILGLFSTLKPSHCSGGKKGEFRWGQEEAEQGGGPGGAETPGGWARSVRRPPPRGWAWRCGDRAAYPAFGEQSTSAGQKGHRSPFLRSLAPHLPHEIYKRFLHGKAQMPADSFPPEERLRA